MIVLCRWYSHCKKDILLGENPSFNHRMLGLEDAQAAGYCKQQYILFSGLHSVYENEFESNQEHTFDITQLSAT